MAQRNILQRVGTTPTSPTTPPNTPTNHATPLHQPRTPEPFTGRTLPAKKFLLQYQAYSECFDKIVFKNKSLGISNTFELLVWTKICYFTYVKK